MPVTRNQLSGRVSNCGTADSSANGSRTQSRASNRSARSDSPREQSPSPPRLRDRRSTSSLLSRSGPEKNSSSSISLLSNSQKRRFPSESTPTRVLPKRSCARSESSLLSALNVSIRTTDKKVNHIEKPVKETHSTEDHSMVAQSKSNNEVPNRRQRDSSIRTYQASSSEKLNHSKQQKSTATLISDTSDHEELYNASRTYSNLNLSSSSSQRIMSDKSSGLASNKDKVLIAASKSPVRITLPSCVPSCSSSSEQAMRFDKPLIRSSPNTSYIKKIGSCESSKTNPSKTASAPRIVIPIMTNKSNATVTNGIPSNIDRNFNVLIAVTGSVATIKLLDLLKKFDSKFPQLYKCKISGQVYNAKISLRVIMTENSKHFVKKEDILKSIPTVEVFDDADEWSQWSKIDDPVLHVELRKWAHILLIAPLDANTMGKMCNGICDNLLTCVVRAWDTSKRLIYCPAMNVHMYNHPITSEHLRKLQSYGYQRIGPIEKRLACGDIGIGAMAEVDTIVNRSIEILLNSVLVSPTAKPLLNQHPTYPIISVSAALAKNSLSSSPLALTANIQKDKLSSNTFGTSARNSHNLAGCYAIYSEKKQIASNLIITKKNPPNNRVNLGPNFATYSRPSIVTSVKNLQAMDNNIEHFNEDWGRVIDYNNDDDDFLEPRSNEQSDEDNELIYDHDIDPSRLLEQSLITDDNTSHQTNTTSMLNGSSSNVLDTDFQSPIFNTSKFLALCYNKIRDCYKCAICKNDYKNRKSMARHLKEQHMQGDIYRCGACCISFKRRGKLVKHNRERHGIMD